LLASLTVFVATACGGGDRDDTLVDAYDRMMATSERRAAEDVARRDEAETVDLDGFEEPPPPSEALPIDTLPAVAATLDTASAPAPEPAFEGTLEPEQRRATGDAIVLRAVRTAEHDDFDRLVFEFDGSVPGYTVEFADRPIRECGSGRELNVPGQAWLRVRLSPARAHEFVGDFAQVTVASRNRALDHEVVQQLVLTCDFEAQVVWVAGLSTRNRYRTLQLSEPARLVVDILH